MKSINILLSSYNGEKYIAKQIISVMQQQEVSVKLTIRDDGSTDNTVMIIERLSQKYINKIELIKGSNIGYRRSFLQLLKCASYSDYYAFCDQDDYWLPDKCKRGISKLEKEKDLIALYATGVTLTDENLNIIGKTDSWNMPLTVESYFTRQRLAGCTYIFNNGLRELAMQFADLDLPDAQMPDHDFVVGSCAFSCGKVYLDKVSNILHRRHSKSVTSGGVGIKKRVKTEYELVFKRPHVQSTMAKLLLRKYLLYMNSETQLFLKYVSVYNRNIISKIRLIFYPKMKTGMPICDMETKIKIILGYY